MSDELVGFVKKQFRALRDPKKAPQMAAYMKTEMPFYGIQKPHRVPVYRQMRRDFAPASQAEYRRSVLALWNLSHREEKYAAIEFACHFKEFITRQSLPLYKRMIQEGAWWDLVDGPAVTLVGTVYLNDRKNVQTTIDQWSDHRDLWLRRTAIICQNRHKEQTDHRRLFRFSKKRAHETEFFIRKGIGWALREYSYSDPERVRDFLVENRERLSGLSLREGAKQLARVLGKNWDRG